MKKNIVLDELRVIRGDKKNFYLRFNKDITGYTIYFTVRKILPATTILDDTDATIAIEILPTEITDPASGLCIITLTETDTNKDVGKYYYDIQIKTDDDGKRSSGIGYFFIDYDVTRS